MLSSRMNRSPRLFLVASVLHLVLMSSAQDASAQDSDIKALAKELVSRGLQAQTAGRYDEAVDLYQTAYDLLPHPELLFNIGQAYRLKGAQLVALTYYHKYLALQPEGRAAKEAAEWAVVLEKSLGENEVEARQRAEQQRRMQATEHRDDVIKDEPLSAEPAREAMLWSDGDKSSTLRAASPHPPAPLSREKRDAQTTSDWRRPTAIAAGIGSLLCITGSLVLASGDEDRATYAGGLAVAGGALTIGGAILWLGDTPPKKPLSAEVDRHWTPTFAGKTAGLVISTAF